MTGRVRENVYDFATGRHLLVPQGTTIVGVYDRVVTFGQQRLLIAWQRLVFPDGTKLNIGGMPGADLLGAAGFSDEVDRHYKRIFGSVLLLNVMTAGVTLSQENDNGNGLDDQGSTRDQATALGQTLGEVASQMLRREMNVQPTLRIPPGYRFNVLVNKDLIFEGPYLNTDPRVGNPAPVPRRRPRLQDLEAPARERRRHRLRSRRARDRALPRPGAAAGCAASCSTWETSRACAERARSTTSRSRSGTATGSSRLAISSTSTATRAR
jgi:hypothetical protein